MRRPGSVFLVVLALVGALSAPGHAAAPSLDAFSRTVWTNWGTGPLGAWTWETTSGAPLALSVDGAVGWASSASGVNKGNAFVGPSRGGGMLVRATLGVDRQPTTGIPNHAHLLVRRAGIRTYYSAYVMPSLTDGPATLSIMSAKDGEFDTPITVTLPFTAGPGLRFRLEAEVSDVAEGTRIRARAWPLHQRVPAFWQADWTDTALDRILEGRAGVRLSVYSSPAAFTVDTFLSLPL